VKKPKGIPSTGPFFYGTFDQRKMIDRWENAGWVFVHWTEVPDMVAVMQDPAGQIIFIDQEGIVWKGPTWDKKKPVPEEKYPGITVTV
jgi:hypothetical protein